MYLPFQLKNDNLPFTSTEIKSVITEAVKQTEQDLTTEPNLKGKLETLESLLRQVNSEFGQHVTCIYTRISNVENRLNYQDQRISKLDRDRSSTVSTYLELKTGMFFIKKITKELSQIFITVKRSTALFYNFWYI